MTGTWPEGGGELGALIRSFDWAGTSLGPSSRWPQPLKTVTDMLLRSAVPMVVLWGPDGIMIYNDAYAVFAGGRHPRLLGSKVLEGWPEVADFNRQVMAEGLAGRSLSFTNQELVLHRKGVPEKVALSLDYSPILGEDGRPAGRARDRGRDDRARPRGWDGSRSRAAFPPAGSWRDGLRHLHARSDGRGVELESGRRADQGLSARRDRGRPLFALLYRGRSRGRRARQGLGHRDRDRQIRKRGLARAQERRALLGQRRHRRDPGGGRDAGGLCQGHARHDRAPQGPTGSRRGARGPVPVAEDGGGRPIDRRRGP